MSGMLNGEWDRRGIVSGDYDFAAHKLNNIDKCWYPNPEYHKMNPLEKRRLYLNQKKKKESSDWSKRKSPTSINAVSFTNTQMPEIYTFIDILATHVKNQDNRLKRMISNQMADKYHYDKRFSSSKVEYEGTNRNNSSLVRGRLKSINRGRNR